MLWEDCWLYMLVNLCLKYKCLLMKVLLRLYREVSLWHAPQAKSQNPTGAEVAEAWCQVGKSDTFSITEPHGISQPHLRQSTPPKKVLDVYLRWEMVCNGVWKILPNDKQSGLQEIRGRRLVALMWLSVHQYVQTVLSVLSHQLKWCVLSLTDSRKTINYVDFMVCFPVKPLKIILIEILHHAQHEGPIT